MEVARHALTLRSKGQSHAVIKCTANVGIHEKEKNTLEMFGTTTIAAINLRSR